MTANSKAFNSSGVAAQNEEAARAAAYEKLKADMAQYGGSRGPSGRGRGSDLDWVLYQMANPAKKQTKDAQVRSALGGKGKNELGPDSMERSLQQNARLIAQMEAEAAMLGKSTLARERAAAIADLEANGIKKGTKAYEDRLAAVDALHRANFSEFLRDTTRDLQDEIDALQFDIDMWGKSREEIEAATVARKYDVLAQKLKIDKTEEEQAAIDALIAKYKELALQQQAMTEARRGDWMGGLKQGLLDYYDSVKDVFGGVRDFITNAFEASGDALVEFLSTGKLNFKEFVRSILADMLRMWVRYMIMKPLMDMLMGGFSLGGGGSVSAGGPSGFGFGGGIGGGLPGMAIGGSIAGGRTHLVGENGPELFTPAQSGRITPNHALAGGGPVSVVVNVNSDTGQTSTSGDGGDAARLGKMIGAKVREVIVQEKRVGGMLAQGAY